MPKKELFSRVKKLQAVVSFCCMFVLSVNYTFAQEEIKNCSQTNNEKEMAGVSLALNVCKADEGMCKEPLNEREPQVLSQSISLDAIEATGSATPSPAVSPTVVVSPKTSPKPSPSPSLVPTPKASSKPSPSLTPVPTPIPTVIPSPMPTPSPIEIAKTENNGGLDAEVLFQMINAHRQSKGLPAYEKDAKLCEIAQSRGPELHEEIYGSKYIHQGFKERNLPFWITENMISKESEQVAMNWWLNSSLHRAGIESSKKYACGVCVGKSCAMLFTSWDKK